MKDFVKPGEVITVLAPYDVVSGAGVLVGSLFGAALGDALSGVSVELQTTGVIMFDKTSAQAWTVGVRIYWDDTNKVCTTTATSNKLIGVATAVAADPSSYGEVRLNGSFSQ